MSENRFFKLIEEEKKEYDNQSTNFVDANTDFLRSKLVLSLSISELKKA